MVMAMAGGAAVAALYAVGRVVTGESLVVGPGYEVVGLGLTARTISLWILATVLALRCLATSATVAGGGAGGLFIPLVVAGALAGATIGGAVNGGDLELFIVVGVAAFLGAGYRVPLAAVMFVAETRPCVLRGARPPGRRRRRAGHGPLLRHHPPALEHPGGDEPDRVTHPIRRRLSPRERRSTVPS